MKGVVYIRCILTVHMAYRKEKEQSCIVLFWCFTTYMIILKQVPNREMESEDKLIKNNYG